MLRLTVLVSLLVRVLFWILFLLEILVVYSCVFFFLIFFSYLTYQVTIAAFVAPKNGAFSNLQMLFNFKKKAAPAPVIEAPVNTKGGNKNAKTTNNKKAPAPTGKNSKFAATPAPAPVSYSSSFAGGLVGSDVEAPEFDPLQLSATVSEETLLWYRAAELKHARICMLASLGLSVQPAFHLPDPVFDSTLGFGVVTKLYAERPEAIWQILLAIAAVEVSSLFRNGQGVGGDLGFDPLNLQEKLGLNADPAKFEEMQLRELKNGRLAMLGASALLLQEYVTGYGPYEQLFPH